MSGSLIGNLAVLLSMETSAFEKGANHAQRLMAKTQRSFEQMGQRIGAAGRTLSLTVTAPLAALAVTSVKAAQESAEAMGQVDAALKSMGDGAGRTREQLQALASSQMRQSLFDDDEILRKVTANLLTFGSVAGEQFDRAQQAAIDLAARMGTDLQSATIMIGKALNDPAKGLASLRRVGIQFTEQQQDQIKAMAAAGNAAGAQAIMLAELERQFGGSAAAMRAADPAAAMKQSWAEFQETLGQKLLPLLPRITEALTKILDAFGKLSPDMQTAVIVAGGLAAALGPVLMGVGGLVSATGALLPLLVKIVPVIGLLGKALLFIAANPVLLALALVIGGIYLAWQNWDKIKPIVDRVGQAVASFWNDNVKPVLDAMKAVLVGAVTWWWNLHVGAARAVAALFGAVKNWLQEKLGAVFEWVRDKVRAVGAVFEWLYDVVVGNSYIPDLVDGIAAHMARLDAVMVQPAKKAAKATAEAMRQAAEDVRGLLTELFPNQAADLDYLARRATAARIDDAVVRAAAFAEIERRRQEELKARGGGPGDLWKGGGDPGVKAWAGEIELAERFEQVLEGIDDWGKKAKETTVRVAKSFKDMAEGVLSSLSRLSSAIKGGGFLDILEAVIGLGLQLGSAGLFGSKIAGNINKTVPGRAIGGPVVAGRQYLVGERGPELFAPRQSGSITPNHRLGGGGGAMKLIVEPSELFHTRLVEVEDRAATRGAVGGRALTMDTLGRKAQRRLGRG